MKIKHELFIDNYVAKPIAYALNFLVRFLGKILSIDHSLDRKLNRIVICKFKGMGSIIQATPMIQAIKNKHPHAELIFVSTSANRIILEKITPIDKIITINDTGVFSLVTSLLKTLFTLIKNRPDVYIDLEIYSNFSTLVTLFSLSKNRIGFYLRSSSFRMGIYTHMMFFNSTAPISKVYLQIARLFGPIESIPSLFPLNKNLSPQKSFSLNKEYIVINPNASDLRLERRWGSLNFTKLISAINKDQNNLQIVLIGGPKEVSYTNKIHEVVNNENVINLAGKTTIDKLIITNDTGPMHIAFACKTPSICFFGPCSPQQYALTENAVVLYKKVYCSPCVHDFSIPPCKGNNVCMQMITVDEVVSIFKEFVANDMKKPHAIQTLASEKLIYSASDHTIGQVNRTI